MPGSARTRETCLQQTFELGVCTRDLVNKSRSVIMLYKDLDTVHVLDFGVDTDCNSTAGMEGRVVESLPMGDVNDKGKNEITTYTNAMLYVAGVPGVRLLQCACAHVHDTV